jgi:hypothetical protein
VVSKLLTHSAPGRLRQPFDDEHPRHDRELREMPLEERLVDGHALDADGALVAIHVDDAVDHQEGIAMRQELHHPRDVSRAELLRGTSLCHCLARSQLIVSPPPRYKASLVAAGAPFFLR